MPPRPGVDNPSQSAAGAADDPAIPDEQEAQKMARALRNYIRHNPTSSLRVPEASAPPSPAARAPGFSELANALRELSLGAPAKELNVDKGKPSWDSRTERFHTFSLRVGLWLQSLDLQHLLTTDPEEHEQRSHDKVFNVISQQLPPSDLDYVRGSKSVRVAWSAHAQSGV